MQLSFKKELPNGRPTKFPEKIMLGLKPEQLTEDGLEKYGQALKAVQADAVTPKIHTFREASNDRGGNPRWKKDLAIHFVTDQRQKTQCTFAEGVCTGTQRAKMCFAGASPSPIFIWIDDRLLSPEERKQVAINDGFDSYEQFHEWFAPIIEENSGCYEPVLIHWTDKRY